MEQLSNTLSGLEQLRKFEPLEHYDYRVLDVECGCAICIDWRAKQAALDAAQATLAGHVPIRCRCAGCRQHTKLRSAQLAARNRRDLYCECSWHASMLDQRNAIFDLAASVPGSGLGERFMDWVHGQVHTKSDGWWEKLGPQLTLGTWFDNFTYALEASGIGLLPVSGVASRP